MPAVAGTEGRHQEAKVREDQREEDVDAGGGALQGRYLGGGERRRKSGKCSWCELSNQRPVRANFFFSPSLDAVNN
jgi:hypothetical protein